MSERFSDRRLSLPALGLLAGTLLPGDAGAQETIPKVELSGITDMELLERDIVVEGNIKDLNAPAEGLAIPYMKDSGNGLEVVYLDVRVKAERACLVIDSVQDAGSHWRVNGSEVRISQPNMNCEAWGDAVGLPMTPFELGVEPKEAAQGPVEKVGKKVKTATPSSGFDLEQTEMQLGVGFYREERDMHEMWVNPSFDTRISVPLPAGFVVGPSLSFYVPAGEAERSGLGAVGAFVGRDFDLFNREDFLRPYLEVGYAPDWHPALDAPYAALGLQVNVLDIDPIDSSVGANCEVGRDFIGTGWFLTGDPALGFSCVATITMKPLAFLNASSGPKPKPVVQEAPEVPAVVGTVAGTVRAAETTQTPIKLVDYNRRFHNQAYREFPDLNYKIEQTLAGENSPEKAEVVNFRDSIKKYAAIPQWKGAYQTSLDLLEHAQEHGIELAPEIFVLIFESATAQGDALLAYECAKILAQKGHVSVVSNPSLWPDTVREMERQFGWVSLVGSELQVMNMPFAPNMRNQIQRVQEEFDGRYQGLLAVTSYTLDNIEFTPVSISEGGQVLEVNTK